jgi:hypothetical protein
LIDVVGIMGVIAPGIAYGVVYIIFGMVPISYLFIYSRLAIPLVLMMDIPVEFELVPKEQHVEREKRLSRSRRDSLSEQSLPFMLDSSSYTSFDSSSFAGFDVSQSQSELVRCDADG